MARLRVSGLDWLAAQEAAGVLQLAFRDASNSCSYLLVEAVDHVALHRALDPDPLISYSEVRIEPVLRTGDMVRELTTYLGSGAPTLKDEDWRALDSHGGRVDPAGSYFLAVKEVRPFSPLLPVAEQEQIHANTLVSQRAHSDGREILDVNPVGRAVGILIMAAADEREVQEHVHQCEVFVDTTVTYTRLLTITQARESNAAILVRMLPGCMRA